MKFSHIPDDKFLIVKGLPFNLALNRTALQQSTAQFGKYNFKKEKPGRIVISGGTKITFKKRTHFITMPFDRKSLPRYISITTGLTAHSVNWPRG